jgi:hypothetical protein
MKLTTCPYCGDDNVVIESSEPLDTQITSVYRFKVWMCIFLCRLCQTHFTVELDDLERKEYL